MPGPPRICSNWEKTAETAHRLGWRGKMILQIKEAQKVGYAMANGPEWSGTRTRWRDAAPMDFVRWPASPVTNGQGDNAA